TSRGGCRVEADAAHRSRRTSRRANQPMMARQARVDLFLISLLILFLELSCIRWFPAHVLFLTFFTNTMLLACFLGMSVGCLAAGRRRDYLVWTPLLLAVALALALLVDAERRRLDSVVDVGHQASPQLVFFGVD